MSIDTTLKTFNKHVDRVLKEKPGPDRWLEARRLWLAISPVNREFNQLACEQNKLTREYNSNEYGVAKGDTANFRQFMAFPRGVPCDLKRFLEIVDPELFKDKSNSERLYRTFPEYTTAEKL